MIMHSSLNAPIGIPSQERLMHGINVIIDAIAFPKLDKSELIWLRKELVTLILDAWNNEKLPKLKIIKNSVL